MTRTLSLQPVLHRWQLLCDTVPGLLHAIDAEVLSHKPAPGKWSKQEIIGHLIDSATNNHHRFVRGQFEPTPSISYQQDAWNRYSYYQALDGHQLIAFWEAYNRHLLAVVSHMSASALERPVRTGNAVHTIAFLVEDYVAHMEHHLAQLVVLP